MKEGTTMARHRKRAVGAVLAGLLALPASQAGEPETMSDVMQRLEAAMVGLNAALMRGDLPKAEAAARRIARPPLVSTDKRLNFMESLGRYREHVAGLGREMQLAAEAVARRAGRGDMRGATRRYLQLFQTCTDCHGFFRAARAR